MNILDSIQQLIDEKTLVQIERELGSIWDGVWQDKNKNNYAKLRLFKSLDKIATLKKLGVDFRNKRVLDIGCGDGTILNFLEKHYGCTGTGVDISQHAISNLNSSGMGQVNYILGDHRKLDNLENNSYDIVISLGVIEHFDEYLLAIAEARRVLKSGGAFIMIQPHLFSFGVLQELWLKLTGRWRFGNQKDFSYLYYRRILSKLGFSKIIIETKIPYHDMKYTRILDMIIKKMWKNWGHYLYLIAYK